MAFRNRMTIFLVLCAAALLGVVISSPVPLAPAPAVNAHWNYDDPNSWRTAKIECQGEHQSPIDINPNQAVLDPTMPRITFDNFNKIYPQTVSNTGHTIVLKLQKNANDDDLPSISDGGLNGTYVFQQLHFHWGSDNRRGSEHQIAGKQYPAELHIVHYNKKYGNFEEAVNHPDGLAVLAIFIEMQLRDNIAFRHIGQFDLISHPDSNSTYSLSNPIALADLIPDNPNTFYRYTGSLTTPGCNEAVTWTVFDTPSALSERQINEFRKVFDSEGRLLVNNFRPVQSLHDRTVIYRFDQSN